MYTAPNRMNSYIKYNIDMFEKKDLAYFKKHQVFYPADKNGLFHVAGNVSEWVSYENKENPTFTKAMGGNWTSFENDCYFNSAIDVDKEFASGTIGFRIVAEKINANSKSSLR
jgi:hypothetical protein